MTDDDSIKTTYYDLAASARPSNLGTRLRPEGHRQCQRLIGRIDRDDYLFIYYETRKIFNRLCIGHSNITPEECKTQERRFKNDKITKET